MILQATQNHLMFWESRSVLFRLNRGSAGLALPRSRRLNFSRRPLEGARPFWALRLHGSHVAEIADVTDVSLPILTTPDEARLASNPGCGWRWSLFTCLSQCWPPAGSQAPRRFTGEMSGMLAAGPNCNALCVMIGNCAIFGGVLTALALERQLVRLENSSVLQRTVQ